jgi:oligoribonuclease
MKYLSLDLETTCLQPDPKHILQVSMVVEDTKSILPVEELPHFTCFVKHDRIEGEAYALGMNGWILDIISGRNKKPPYDILSGDPKGFALGAAGEAVSNYWLDSALEFLHWHFGKDKITVAGKNVAGFDIPFLPKELRSRFRHKVLDPATLFVNWETDDQAPNFETCKQRAGISGVVAHDAREDAMDVIRMLRMFYV